MQKEIREFIINQGVDDVGFAQAADYKSPKSYEIERFMPDAKSIIVLAFRVLSSCESPSWSAALNGYLDLGAFARSTTYRVARFLENKYSAKVANMPLAYPFEFSNDRRGIADFSQRHAAVAAGLGVFGRHNLVIHPRFGTRVNFASIITNLEIEPSAPVVEDLCSHCNLCVQNCPGEALNDEGKTDIIKCMKNSQPYGLGADIAFRIKLAGSTPSEQMEMFKSEQYARLHQAAHIGNQYMCFNCLKICPVGMG
jgi:epoxyqueuosine reductase QueG